MARGRDERGYSMSDEGGIGLSGKQFVTWLHEIGHQITYKKRIPQGSRRKGTKSLTNYGGVTDGEWFAEHFAAFMLDKNAIKEWDENVFQYFDDLLASL